VHQIWAINEYLHAFGATHHERQFSWFINSLLAIYLSCFLLAEL
jgi:hypothetical protein